MRVFILSFVFILVSVLYASACVCVCVWSHLAGVFLEGNMSICCKKAACDLTPGPCCNLPLSARRARDMDQLRKREREIQWGGGQRAGGTERERDAKTERNNNRERKLQILQT